MNKYTTFLAALAVLGTSAAYADGIALVNSRGFNTNLEVTCSGVKLGEVKVNGSKAITVSAKDANPSYLKNAPELPQYSAMVMVNPNEKPVFSAKSLDSIIIDLDAPVVPSKGNIKRTINPAKVAYKYGKVYKEDRWYPSDKELVEMGTPFIFRETRGVNLIVHPVQYNPVQNKLKIHKTLKISLASDNKRTVNTIAKTQPISKAFEPIYKNTFINYSQAASRLPRLNEVGRLLIICDDPFMEVMKPFVEWKQKCGLTVDMVPMSKIGNTNYKVKEFVSKEYDKGGLTNLMLIGDAFNVPTLRGENEGADSDTCYAKLAGDDHVPDIMVSRLSAETPEDVSYQVAKFLNYEQYTTKDTKWYTRLLGIGSAEGNPKDYEYIDQIRETLTTKGSFKDAEKIYDPGAAQTHVVKAINKGVSLVNYLGHGSGLGWGTTRFTNRWMKELTNGWMQPVIFDVACLNGQFNDFDGFGEAWMRAGSIDNPAGAVTYVGASTSMEWIPPIHVQAEINKELICNEVYKTTGGLHMNGIMKGLELYTTDPKQSGVQLLEQWNMFGDSTLRVRFKAPSAMKAETKVSRAANNGTKAVKIDVKNSKGKAVNNAVVTVYTNGMKFRRVATTNSDGQAVLTVPANLENAYMTVTGDDVTPIIDQPIKF